MIALVIVVAVLLIIALLRVGVLFEYGESGVGLRVFVGPVRIGILPSKKKVKKPKKPKKEKKEPEENKQGKLAGFRELLPAIFKALGRLRRRLLIKKLVIYYEAAGDDPASTAIHFGYASAGAGALIPVLEHYFRIRHRDIQTAVSFVSSEPYLYVSAVLSLAVWEVIYIGFGVLAAVLRKNTAKTKNGKEVKENG